MEREILNFAPVPMILYKEKIVYANPSALELLGCDYEYIVGKCVWEIFSEEHREYIKATALQRLNNALPRLDYQSQLVTKDNDKRWVNVISTTVHIQNEFMGLATIFDITEKKILEEELATREKMWADMFNRHTEIMLFIDAEGGGKIIDANPAAAQFYGYSQEELRRMNISDINTLSQPTVFREMQEAMSNRKNSFYFVHRLANGELRNVQVSSVSIRTRGKNVLFSIVNDITEQLSYEQKLAESEARYRFIAENSTDMITRIRRDGRYDYVSEASLKLLGFAPEEMIGHNPLEFVIHPEEVKAIQEFTNSMSEAADVATVTHRMRKKDGDYTWLETTAKKLTDANGKYMGVLAVSRDVTKRRQIEERLKEANKMLLHLSSRDGLTGIPNRRAFDQYFVEAWEAYTKIALIMIDIDYFKKYNDTYGHLQGDDCLQKVALCLEQCISPMQFVARYGGEEFVVIAPEMDALEASELAEHIRSSIEALQIPHAGSEVSDVVSISLGVSDSLSATSITELIEKADEALYQAKRTGRNKVIVYKKDSVPTL